MAILILGDVLGGGRSGGVVAALQGIHLQDGDLAGRAMGRQVAAQASDKAQAYITGQATI